MMKKENITEQAKKLIKYFPDVPIEEAKKIDIEIKQKILGYESQCINEDVAKFIQDKVQGYTKSKDRIKKKSRKIAALYLENNRIWGLQEGWFCLIAYIITVITMIFRVIEIDNVLNDILSFSMYLVALIVWIIIIQSKKMMDKRAEIFLKAFNHHAPSLIIFNLLIFYLAVLRCSNKIYWILVIVVFLIMMTGLTLICYRRLKKELKF